MITDIAQLKVWQKVHYQPDHYKDNDEYENGIIKEVPNFATDPGSIHRNCVCVVYNCAGNWDKYQDYTSALTNLCDLNIGWKHEKAED